ncbi:MAG: peptidylprolyl isomerase [Rhodospirillaceae bacterium]|jgi:peptidyl-prolyl cis-trans isomerase C|nr:peptidylprolyl isomerase [Rhodospirillaceae bacterium]MBT4487139.1 peptidylprolyl isomerase [Rhodospirillaceae bacterium]MBT5897839.1 peptidylprolyl isomerase [Rhodospirillaceae bacterium]MBT7759900.1 peptidylprolyl isomerase [Rhodospirillaceae bacterium]
MIKLFFSPLAACLTVVMLLSASPSRAQSQDQKAAPPPSDDQVVAVVNGSKVLFRDVRLAYENLPQQYRGMPIDQIYQPLVQQLTERRLVLLAAEAANLADEPEVASQIQQARNRILEQALVSREVTAAATDKALRARYEEEKGKQKGADEVRASHILVETKEEADAIVAELNKGGDFAAIAKTKSKGPSGAKGGDLGYFTKDKMVPEFANAAFALKAGELSAPVKTGFGWHVIKVTDRRQGEGPSYAKRAPELRQAIAQTVVAALLKQLSKGADIKLFKLDGSPADAPKKAE